MLAVLPMLRSFAVSSSSAVPRLGLRA